MRGVDLAAVQQMMGHSEPGVTMGIYAHVMKNKKDYSAIASDFENYINSADLDDEN